MLALVIRVNGQQVLTLALESGRSIGAHLTWIGHETDPLLFFHVGGVEGDRTLRWEVPDVGLGDEISIRIEPTEFDARGRFAGIDADPPPG